MKKFLALILAAMMVASMAACGSSEETNTNTESTGNNTESTTTAAAQYYNTYMSADPTSMDISRISDSYSAGVVNNVMEPLVRMGETEDGNYVIEPGDAATWESNDDATVWTFHLGDNTWSDGQPVTAHDYVYSLQRSADPATGCPNEYFLEPIAGYYEVRDGASLDTLGVKALDDKTLEITLSHPVPSYLDMCCGSVYYPIRKDAVEQYGELYGTEPSMVLTNGAYNFDSWTHNSSITLSKRDGYWNADAVQIENVTVHILGDSNTAYTMFEANQIDYVGTSTAEWVAKFTAMEDVDYVKTMGSNTNYAFYNTQDALFQNANIRKAFNMATERQLFNEVNFGGRSNAATGWIPMSMSVGGVNYREYAGDLMQAMYDEADAAGMTAKDYLLKGMEELGLGNDPSTLDITFSLAGTDDWFRTLGEFLQQIYGEALGVNLKIDFSEWGIFSSNLNTGNYQIGYMGWGAYYNDPYDMLSLFCSDIDAIQTKWVNTEYDELVKEAFQTMDADKRMEMYAEAERILLLEDCVVNPILFPSSNSFYRNYVQGYATLAFSNGGYQGMNTGARA
ncbi:MAG: peptide ABC transporter substrate-binding protein, partial [Oscillospiraceae bacterium]|nr:peptide ABC transporter substrate-binding protein [Oscillospiraceae bacterium]